MSDKIRIISDKFELDDIAESVREKTKLTGKMSLEQIAHNIRRMAGIGQGILTTDATIESGDQMLDGVTAYGASGIVTGTIPSQEATNIIPNDDEQIAIPAGTYAEGNVTVSPVPTETMSISSNGTYIPEDGKYFSSVNVNVKSAGGSFETQSKTVTPTESRQTVSPDAEYNGLSNVVVEPIPVDYVGSGVTRQAEKTITPTKSTQTAVEAGVYTEGDVVVEAIPSEYITTTDATATSEHIFLDETAYVNGEKITGTFTIDEEITTQEEKIAAQDTIIADIVSALEGKAVGGSGEVNTCTVRFVSGENVTFVGRYYYTKYANGMITSEYFDSNGGSPFDIILENVVCNSFILFEWTPTPMLYTYAHATIEGSSTMCLLPINTNIVESDRFKAPSEADVTAVVTFYAE